MTNHARLLTMRLSLPPAVLLCSLLLATHACADWPMFRADAARSGAAPEDQFGGLEIAWSAELGGSVDSSPAVVGDRVFVGNSLGSIFALSSADGSILWRAQTGGAVQSSPAFDGGLVVVGSVDGFLYALDAATGEQRWCYRTRGPVISSPAIVGGSVLFGSMDGRLYCLRLDTGELVWRSEQGAAIQGAPAVAGEVVLYGDDDAKMRALRLSDGSPLWEIQGSGKVLAAPVVGENIALFSLIGPSALRPPKLDYLIAVRPETGERVWALNEAYSIFGSPVIAGGRVFFATVEGYVSKTVFRAADLATGVQAWEAVMPGVVDSSPAAIGGPAGFDAALTGVTICAGCHDGRLYLLDAASGRIVDTEPLATKIYSSPAVTGGRIYIGANDGRLYCLRAPA